ncbi:MAG: dockerin type I domain-containing protein, partial [Phycisphaerae bacterium]
AASGGTTALGALSGSAFLALHGSNATFAGQSVLASDVLVAYTIAGDTSLKGYIDASDFAQIDAAWLKVQNGTPNSGFDWINGDFNHDGKVDPTDFALIDAAYTLQNGHLAAGILAADQLRFAGTTFDRVYQAALGSASPIPEPTSLGLLALGALGLLARRR